MVTTDPSGDASEMGGSDVDTTTPERTAASGPVAGWYADPQGGNGHRWWDGSAWTEHVKGGLGESLGRAPLAPGGAASPSRHGTIIGLVGAIALFFLTFSRWTTLSDGQAFNALDRGLPWFLTGADYDPVFERGFFAHGWLLIIIAIAAVVLIARASRRLGGAHNVVALGVLAVLLTVANALSFRSGFDSLTGVSTGMGLWLSLLAGLLIAVSGGLLMANQ